MGLDIEKARAAIAAIESQGSGDYAALGPVTNRGDRAYGRYQIMGANLPQWTQEALGRQLTPEQFGADKEAQDAVFAHRFQKLYDQYGTVNDAASAWFTGRPQRSGGNSKDILGTSGNQYVAKFAKAYGDGGDAGGYADTGDQPVAPGILSQAAPAVADMPAEGAAEAQGLLSLGAQQQQNPNAYQPTLTDNLNSLSAALLRRDSPEAAAGIDRNLATKRAENTAFLRAQAASDKWTTTGKPYKAADGTYKILQQRRDGTETRAHTLPANEAPAETPEEALQPPRGAQTARDEAYKQYNNLSVSLDAVDNLIDKAISGKLKVSWDQNLKTYVANATNSSGEDDWENKDLKRQAILATNAIAATVKGATTDKRWNKEYEAVMPSGAMLDTKASTHSLMKVRDVLRAQLESQASAVAGYGNSYPSLKNVFADGKTVDANELVANRFNHLKAAEEMRKPLAEKFFKDPLPGSGTTKPKTLFDTVMGN